MILFKKRITQALIRLRGCAGWSAPVLFATPEDRFSHVEAQSCIMEKYNHIAECNVFISLIKKIALTFSGSFCTRTEDKTRCGNMR